MSQNWTLIGCLDKTGQDQHLKLSLQSHIAFYKVRPQAIFVAGTIYVPQPLIFFWSPHFIGTESYPFSRKGEGTDTVIAPLNLKGSNRPFTIIIIIIFLFHFGFQLHFEQIFWDLIEVGLKYGLGSTIWHRHNLISFVLCKKIWKGIRSSLNAVL